MTAWSVPGRDLEVAQVRAFWQRLELPGLIDVHTHFLPPNIEAKVWASFDIGGPKVRKGWPITYRESPEERLELLRAFGVRRFPTLPYAHREGVAAYLNAWSRTFAADHSDVIWSGTFYPEADAGEYVARLVADGVEVFKVHTQVGEFDLRDPALDAVWATLERSGTPALIHSSSAPVPTAFTGPDGLRAVLERWPELVIIVAHLGEPEFDEFLALADRFPNVLFDTTLVFTDFTATSRTFPEHLLDRLLPLQRRILFGTDFPIVPHPYLAQLEALRDLGLGDEWLRDVCWNNAHRLFGRMGG